MMKAGLMRVNYDPKYTTPHLTTSASASRSWASPGNANAQSRFNATRQIYNNLSPGTASPEKKLHEVVHQRAKERLKQAVEELKTSYNSMVQNQNGLSPVANQPTVKLPPAGVNTRMISRSMTNIPNIKQQRSFYQNNDSSDSELTSQVKLMKLVGPGDTTVLKSANCKYQPMLSCAVQAPQKLQFCDTYNSGQFPKVLDSIYHQHLSQTHTSASLKSPNNESKQGSLCFSYLKSKTSLPPECFNFELERRARVEAETAIKAGKIFTVLGPYPSLRASLRRRGWVEKFQNPSSGEGTVLLPKSVLAQINEDDADSKNNVVGKRKGEGDILALMSYYVRNCTPSLVFSVKSIDVVSQSTKTNQLVNHFGRSSAFTTKAGLCQCLRNAVWFEDVDPATFYPRCFNLGEADELNAFIDEYRLTACVGFLKHLIFKLNENEEKSLVNTDSFPSSMPEQTETEGRKPNYKRLDEDILEKGNTVEEEDNFSQSIDLDPRPVRNDLRVVPVKAVKFAMKQCQWFLSESEHDDVDMFIKRDTVSDNDWEQFLKVYHIFVSYEMIVDEEVVSLLESCEVLLSMLQQKLPQHQLDGFHDIWIVKPGAKSRGRGIQCTNRLSEILETVKTSDCSLVVQKYIERPFLIHKTKFDIRQWFLVTDWYPLTLWFYGDCYLRFCSKEFSLDDFHVSIHLSNNSVQKYYTPDPNRSTELPADNMWTSDEFVEHLGKEGRGEIWKDSIVPGMKKAVLCALLCSQDQVEPRKGSFELFGADFMLDEELRPWLIEINSSPSMARNTRATAKLVDCVMEDTLKVVLDRKSDRNCDIGRFELAYKAQAIKDPPVAEPDLVVEGKRIRHKICRKSP